MTDNVIKTKPQKAWLRGDGIVQMEALAGVEQTKADAMENIKAGFIAEGNKRRPVLVDLRKVSTLSREARLYYSGPEPTTMETAAAQWIGTPIGQMIGNFFMGFNKTLMPMKIFTSEEEAVRWLKGFLE